MAQAAQADIEEQTETERVASELLLAAIAFERFSVDMTARIMTRFEEMERDLVAAMLDLDYQAPRNETQRKARISQLMTVAEDIVGNTYDDISDDMVTDLRTVAEVSEGSTINALALVLGAAFVVGKLRGVPLERLHEISDDARFDGALISEWLEHQQDDTMFRFQRVIMDAEANGLDIGDVVESIRGARAAQRQDGAFQTARRNVETLIKTFVMVVVTQARLETLRINSGEEGAVIAVGQISTLDSRTSDICIAYAGRRWTVPDYEPIGHTLPFNGGTPRHPRCRSQIVPIISRDSKPNSATDYGPVPAKWSYEDWLRSRPADEQKDILGATKYDLWRKGKMNFRDLVDQRGNPLSVAELVRRFSRRQPD
jgi:hypothetical protein